MGIDLEGMTKSQIIEYALRLGIELKMTMTKAEMIQIIEEG